MPQRYLDGINGRVWLRIAKATTLPNTKQKMRTAKEKKQPKIGQTTPTTTNSQQAVFTPCRAEITDLCAEQKTATA